MTYAQKRKELRFYLIGFALIFPLQIINNDDLGAGLWVLLFVAQFISTVYHFTIPRETKSVVFRTIVSIMVIIPLTAFSAFLIPHMGSIGEGLAIAIYIGFWQLLYVILTITELSKLKRLEKIGAQKK